MEFLGTRVEDWFFIIGSIYMIVMLLVVVGAVAAALVVKRRVTHKIKDVKAVPLKGKTFVTTFLKSFFR